MQSHLFNYLNIVFDLIKVEMVLNGQIAVTLGIFFAFLIFVFFFI